MSDILKLLDEALEVKGYTTSSGQNVLKEEKIIYDNLNKLSPQKLLRLKETIEQKLEKMNKK